MSAQPTQAPSKLPTLALDEAEDEQISQDEQSIPISVDQSNSQDTQSILPPETQQSSSPSSFPTISISPTAKLALGAKTCQCDPESNLCLNDNLLISHNSRDPINLCIV